MTTSIQHILFSVALAAATTLVGCRNAPEGSSSNRIGTTTTTGAERKDPRILPVTLTEFSDQASRNLAQDLGEIPELGSKGVRATVILGDINNKTGIVASDEFELVKKRMRSNLLSSKYVRGKVRWVENRARLAQLAAREGVGTPEVPAGPNSYDPRHTFTLNMDVYRINRGRVNQYYMEVQVVSFASNEIIFSDRFEVKQVQQKP
jgi:hypothetical protein